jgi:hypothetical protein
MVAAVHTAASDLRWHPHVHAITSRGGFDQDGTWHPVPYVDEKAAELLFRQKVIRLLHDQELLSQNKLDLLDAWKAGHTGFSAHNRVTVSAQDKDGLERLARYLVRSPVSLERLELDGALVRYRHKRAHPALGEAFDAHDFLARVLMHVPAPRLHTVRYYGHYASAARGRRPKLDDQADSRDTELTEESAIGSDDKAHRRRLRRQWAQLIRRIYEADPLLCTCGETMRIVSFVLEGAVIRKILQHLEQRQLPARAPPEVTARLDHQSTAPTA